MNMKRLLLTLICCSPLLFSPSLSFSVDLTGPTDTTQSRYITDSTELSSSNFEQYGPVNDIETLWAISSKLRPDRSVSVQQTMVAIYKSNLHAFYRSNINKIIPGTMLTVPTLEYVQQQTNKEAVALIKQFSVNKNMPLTARTVKKTATAVQPVVSKSPSVSVKATEVVSKSSIAAVKPTGVVTTTQAEQVKSIEVETIQNVVEIPAPAPDSKAEQEQTVASETKIESQSQINKLEYELDQLSEQYIIATQTSQTLKLKLQPLQDQIAILTEELKAEKEIKQNLQGIIDGYRATLANVKPDPFAGDGLVNQVMRFITSSLTVLLTIIFTPIILLLLVYMFISRIRAKRELAEHEQEMAESTAILMEETGQFEELLTEDFNNQAEEDIDLSVSEDELLAVDNNDITPVELTDTPIVNDVVDLAQTDTENSVEDDPFGVASLADDEALTTAIELDETELITSEDDPFGVASLADDEALTTAIELDETELITSEDDPFGLASLADDEAELATSADDPFGLGSLADDEVLTTAIEPDETELITSEDDPFGLGSLTDDEALTTAIELDETELITSEDDPFGLASLTDEGMSEAIDLDDLELTSSENTTFDATPKADEGLNAAIDLDDLELTSSEDMPFDATSSTDEGLNAAIDLDDLELTSSEDMPFDATSLTDEGLNAAIDLDDLELTSSEDTPFDATSLAGEGVIDVIDLDEIELASSVDENLNSKIDLDAAVSSDIGLSEEQSLPSAQQADLELMTTWESPVVSATEIEFAELSAELEPLSTDLLDEPASAEASQQASIEDIDDIFAEFNPAELDGLDESSIVTSEITDIEAIDLEIVTQSADELSIGEADDLEFVDLSEFDKDNDLLAKQISGVAFNEQVPLPEVGETAQDDEFIDIETLLGNSNKTDKDEPYSELELDLGLDEFPDVVNLKENVDIDDDENGIGAQLDLARAYLEIDDKVGAKDILMSVVDASNGKQRTEVEKLLSRL